MTDDRDDRIAALETDRDKWKNEAFLMAAHQGIDNYQHQCDRIVVLEVELARARAERDEARADALKYADALIAELNKTLP